MSAWMTDAAIRMVKSVRNAVTHLLAHYATRIRILLPAFVAIRAWTRCASGLVSLFLS